MKQLVSIFMSGAIASLPSIIAALGIIINNNRASARQRKDRSIKIQLDIIEDIYKKFNEISNEYITMAPSVKGKLFEIQEEIIYIGSDNIIQKYIFELYEIIYN